MQRQSLRLAAVRTASVLRLAGSLVLLGASSLATAQTLPEYLLHFHGNTHDEDPELGTPCTGVGSGDYVACFGPFLTTSGDLDTAAPAHFEDNPALVTTTGTGAGDPNWTWTASAPATLQDKLVIRWWGSCTEACVALGVLWDIQIWKNGTKLVEFNDVDATPEIGDVPSLLTLTLTLSQPITLAANDKLSLVMHGAYTVNQPNVRVYYDSTQGCAPSLSGPCDSVVVFNPKDSDGDGVPDVLDECPGTPAGVAVGADGCPAAAACASGGSAGALAHVPTSGVTVVDAAVQKEWTKLGDRASYGAFVHFFRAGTRVQQDGALKALGLNITHDFRRYTTAVFVGGPVSAFRRLVNHPLVMRIQHNKPLRYLDATQSWTTRTRMAQETVGDGPYRDAGGKILTGEGITLGIMDSGLFGAHPDFAGRITHNFKYAAAGYADVMYADSENAGGGHGTHVTGIVAGDGTQSDGSYADSATAPFLPGTFTSASPKSKIIHWGHGAVIFVLNVAVAYQHLLDNVGLPEFRTLKAVNNSYGDGINPDTDEGYPYNPGDADSQLINRIIGCGVNMVFAAGNDGGDGTKDRTSSYCKNDTPGLICVASYNDQGTGALDAPLSSFSSRGKAGNPDKYPDIAAPGDLSTSTCTQATPTQAICTGGDDTAAETEWQPWYGTISGTSMATPNIVGIIGVLAQAEPTLTPAEMELLIQRTARKVGGSYEADPQHAGSTVHFGYGAGLVDTQAALNDLKAKGSVITKAGLRPTDEEWTVFVDNTDFDVAEGAADVVKLTMQNYNLEGPGVMYRLTVADATDFASPSLAYRVEQNVRGVPTKTTILADADGVSAAEPNGTTNTAVATQVELVGNVISFFVPYSQLGYPPINEPIHNVRVLVVNEAGTLDYAPSPATSTAQSAVGQPMFGRAFTTRLAPGTVPPSTERACELPGLTRVISGAGTTGDSSQTGMDDLRRLWVSEPGDMPGKVVFTVKVDNLNPAPIANYRWYVYFNTPARTDVEAQFVAMDTVAPGGSSAAPGYQRGYRETVAAPGTSGVGVFTIEGNLPNSAFNTNGTITLVLDKTTFNLQTGDAITGLAVSIRQTSNPNNGAGLTVDSASALEPYVLVGNLPCPTTVAPVAALEADVTSGPPSLTVTFDASASTADGEVTDFYFDFGDGSELLESAEPVVQHTYAEGGNYTASLVVRDNEGVVSTNAAEVDIVVHAPPVADAGADTTVVEGAAKTLAGTASDPNGDALTLAWTQVSGPAVTLAGADTAAPSFTGPDVCADDEVEFQLTVTDTTGLSAADTVKVLIDNINHDPLADAGADYAIKEGGSGLLSARGIGDEDCEELEYAWAQVSGPTVELTNATTSVASFIAPATANTVVLKFQLTIEDPAGRSSSDEITVTVEDNPVIGDNAVGGLAPLSLVALGLAGLLGRRRRRT